MSFIIKSLLSAEGETHQCLESTAVFWARRASSVGRSLAQPLTTGGRCMDCAAAPMPWVRSVIWILIGLAVI
jgi:hypothetical protein